MESVSKVFVVVALALAGCAGMRGLEPGQATLADVEAAMGAPAERRQVGGETWLYYPDQPFGRKVLVARLAADKLIGVEQRLTDEPHEACQADEINAVPLQRLDDRAVVARTIDGQAGVQIDGLDTCLAGPQKAGRVRTIRDDHRNPGLELTLPNRLDDRLEIAPPSGDQDT